jgi:hypothetical protein
MLFKVLKGAHKNPELDSTWPDRSRADDRCETLRRSLRKGVVGRRVLVWVEPCNEDDPPAGFRKKPSGPRDGYHPRGPKIIR